MDDVSAIHCAPTSHGRSVAQRGQVMVLGLFLMAALGWVWVHYFRTGETLAEKTRLVHGLDAAAYSGALIQARTLNFLSYLHRAQWAHQLAMAHLVTLGSWAHFGATEANRLAQGNPPAHLIGMQFGPDHGQAYLAAASATGLQSAIRPASALRTAYAAHESFVHDATQSLALALARDLPRHRLDTIRAVWTAHYGLEAANEWDLEIVQDAWPSSLRRIAPDAALRNWMDRLTRPYGFLAPRNHRVRNPWPVSSRCPHKRHELRRTGETRMDAAGRWSSSDTQSFHALRSNRWIGCYFREYPMGWAWVPAEKAQVLTQDHVADPPDSFAEQDFWRWVREATQWDLNSGRANPLANSYAVRDRQAWKSRGLAAYTEVLANNPREGEIGFSVQARWGHAAPGDTDTGASMRAVSAAQSYFSRPHPRADGQFERPSLMQPFWLARLAAPMALNPGD